MGGKKEKKNITKPFKSYCVYRRND